ncbi:terminase small subunit [Alisedimentitalea sp. MJ-SS2]|uniref:terminase small subunit n=1 Tax=Aliisedimentitalea sp. MJ-SS2 TaxID=3049795 RepID=UPI0029144A0B|nr:terminase small subunit [Alisedimentitalea sp. MJ-SS2]MDU8925935.1 terminase small subunit [Alisedimentitalea sp. MJ-SS2]
MVEKVDSTAEFTASQMSAPVCSGLTEKQELFALRVSEGMNFSAAYRETYDTSGMSQSSVWREAHRLSRNEKVAMRIAELVAIRKEDEHIQSRIRAHQVTEHLMETMRSGKTEASRLRAAELLGKSVGLFTVKTEIKNDDDQSLAELEDELRQRLERLKAAR